MSSGGANSGYSKDEYSVAESVYERSGCCFITYAALEGSGPDGFGVSFYQQHWKTLGASLKKVVLDFLNKGVFDTAMNSTYIALILKVNHAKNVCDY